MRKHTHFTARYLEEPCLMDIQCTAMTSNSHCNASDGSGHCVCDEHHWRYNDSLCIHVEGNERSIKDSCIHLEGNEGSTLAFVWKIIKEALLYSCGRQWRKHSCIHVEGNEGSIRTLAFMRKVVKETLLRS